MAQWLYSGANGDLLQEGLCHMPCLPGLLHPQPLSLPCPLLTHAHCWPVPTADPCPLLTHAHCWPVPLQETQKCSQAGLTQSLWDLWALVHTRVFWALWESLVDMGFDSKHDCIPPTILLGLLLFPWMWDVFFGGWDPTVSCSAASCNFGVLTGADELTSFYSTVLALTAL